MSAAEEKRAERERRRAERPWEEELTDAIPDLARLGAGVAWRTARWGADASARLAARAIRAAASGEPASDLIGSAAGELRHWTRQLAGIEADPRKQGRAEPGEEAGPESEEGVLRARGAELIERSFLPETDVDEIHPAYTRILGLISPDEARILRFLAAEGRQPAIDVRSWRPFGIGAEQVASGLSMIAEEAGCRYPGHLPGYLTNLHSIGLVWFSRERLPDPAAYLILEAQTAVLEAIERAGRRAKIIRRSIELTPLGEEFCAACIPEPEPYMRLGITTGTGPLDQGDGG